MTTYGRRIAAAPDLIVLARVVGKVAVTQACGHLHPGNAAVLRGALRTAATEPARALIIDLEHLWFETDGFLSAFAPLEREIAAWRGIPLVLVGGEHGRPGLAELCGALTWGVLAPDPVTAFRTALAKAGQVTAAPAQKPA